MRYVLRVYGSRADAYGNRYFLAKLIHVKTGESVTWNTASDSNARSELQKALGLDKWDDYEKFRAEGNEILRGKGIEVIQHPTIKTCSCEA